MNPKNVKKLYIFFSLYIAQTIPMSFFSTVIPVIMREEKFSLISIGMLQMIKLPWILKFLWSPFVDRSSTSLNDYKRWIFSSEIVYAMLILTVAFFDYKTDLLSVIVLIICAFVASATQDIATDALAVLSFSKKDKSLANSMQSMGSFAGTMIGGGVLLMLFNSFGWSGILPCLSVFVIVMVIPLVFYKGEDILQEQIQMRAKKADVFYFFTQKGIWKQVVFLLLFYSGIIGSLAMLRPWLVDLGYGMKEIGVMSGVVGTSIGFLASFASGFVVRRVSRYRARVIFASLILATTLYFYIVSFSVPSTLLFYIGISFLWGSYGAASVVVYTTAMDRVRVGREGTDFTIQTVITHLSGMIMALVSGHVAQWTGYNGLFLFESLLAFGSLLFVVFVMRETKERRKPTQVE